MTEQSKMALFPVPEGMIRVETPDGVVMDIAKCITVDQLEAMRASLHARIAARRQGERFASELDMGNEPGTCE
jgi:hypothetical protein